MRAFVAARRCAGALAVSVVLPLGCSTNNGDAGPSPSSPGTAASAAREACASIISLVGYAEELLLPAGQESSQSFDSAVRGRIAESIGAAEREAAALPERLRAEALALADAGAALTDVQTPHDKQVAALVEWRRISDEIQSDCSQSID